MKKNYFKISILCFLFLINYSKIYGEEENKKEKEWAITTIYNRGKFYGYGKGYFKDDGPSTTYGVMYMPAKEEGFGFIFKTMESVFKPDPSKSFSVLEEYVYTGEYINKIYSLGTRVQTTDNSVFSLYLDMLIGRYIIKSPEIGSKLYGRVAYIEQPASKEKKWVFEVDLGLNINLTKNVFISVGGGVYYPIYHWLPEPFGDNDYSYYFGVGINF